MVTQRTPDVQSPAPTITPTPDVDETPPPDVPVDIISYESGSYIVGTDIPEGFYVAVNENSDDSRVIVRENQTAHTDKPKVIVTARFANGTFASRTTYVDAISRGGGEPIQPGDDAELYALLREGKIENAGTLAERYDGLMLTGGGDVAAHFFNQQQHPAANPPDETLDRAELALVRAFVRANKPILGICRGMQVVNIALGGELIQDIPDLLGIPFSTHNGDNVWHDIFVRRGTWLHTLTGGRVNVNSFHHQAVNPVAPGFSVVAYTGPVIEAIERGNILGVQFHPERMLDMGMLPFFEDFIYRCSHKNIAIEIFNTHTIIEIRDGQYMEVIGAKLYSLEDTAELFDEVFETNGFYPEGMYLTGIHIPAGDYILTAVDDTPFASYTVSEALAPDSILNYGEIANEATITLKAGEFITLVHGVMKRK